ELGADVRDELVGLAQWFPQDHIVRSRDVHVLGPVGEASASARPVARAPFEDVETPIDGRNEPILGGIGFKGCELEVGCLGVRQAHRARVRFRTHRSGWVLPSSMIWRMCSGMFS